MMVGFQMPHPVQFQNAVDNPPGMPRQGGFGSKLFRVERMGGLDDFWGLSGPATRKRSSLGRAHSKHQVSDSVQCSSTDGVFESWGQEMTVA
jgi:hypothetical protein